MSVKRPKAEVAGRATAGQFPACAGVGDPIPDRGVHHFTKVQHPVQPLAFWGLPGLRPTSESPEAFFWFSQLSNMMGLSYLTPEVTAFVLPGEEVTLESRLTKDWAERIWERMRAGELSLTLAPEDGTHSDAVVAVDRWGNAAAIVHSINTVTWGETGIFVDGISIPDAAAFQQAPMAQAVVASR